LSGTCFNFELEQFLAWFRVARGFVSDSWSFLFSKTRRLPTIHTLQTNDRRNDVA